jgi:hypothetical protein
MDRARALSAVVFAAIALAAADGVAQNSPPTPPAFRFTKLRVRTVVKSGAPPEKVDVVILGDGYLRSHLGPGGKFDKDLAAFKEVFFREPPFKWYRDSFNWYAVYVESYDEGAEDRPAENHKRNAFDSTYNVGGIERLLQFQDQRGVLEAARNAPEIDVIFVIVNDERYGGSGGVVRDRQTGRTLPAPCFSSHGTPSFQVAIHELGHSFANLGDEYVDESAAGNYPLPGRHRDLENPNLTLARGLDLDDPASWRKDLKWGHFLDLPGAAGKVGLHEGAYFREEDVYRPSADCKMRTYDQSFCPVCQEAIVRRIFELTRRPFDDAAYHKRHPIGK